MEYVDEVKKGFLMQAPYSKAKLGFNFWTGFSWPTILVWLQAVFMP